MINTLLDKARRQASGGGGGGGGFAFSNSVYGDGVNDTLSTSASTTCLNPFQQNDWAFNIWFKGSTAFQYNDILFDFNSGGGQSYFQWRTGVGGGATSRYVWLVSNNRGTFSTWEMPTADNTDWHCIGGSVEIVDASNQKIKLYYDGALVDTIGTANNVFTRANTDQRLFGSSSGSPMAGWMGQTSFMDYLPTDAHFTAAYNSGSGADPRTAFTSVKQLFLFEDSAGTVTGTVTDAIGNQDLTMNNFVAPFGVVTESP